MDAVGMSGRSANPDFSTQRHRLPFCSGSVSPKTHARESRSPGAASCAAPPLSNRPDRPNRVPNRGKPPLPLLIGEGALPRDFHLHRGQPRGIHAVVQLNVARAGDAHDGGPLRFVVYDDLLGAAKVQVSIGHDRHHLARDHGPQRAGATGTALAIRRRGGFTADGDLAAHVGVGVEDGGFGAKQRADPKL